MKKKRIQYSNGGTLQLHKSINDLHTSVTAKTLPYDYFNVSVGATLPKGFSAGATLSKFGNKSITGFGVNKQINDSFSVGFSKRKNEKPYYGITFQKKF